MKSLLSTLIIIAVAGVLWLMLSTQRETLLVDLPHPDDGIDAYMNNFTMKAMNSDGRLALTLQARRLRHFANTDIAALTAPVVNIVDADNHQWQVTADNGLIDDARQIVDLENSVRIVRLGGGLPVNIETDFLSIDIDRQRMTTDRPVQMQTGATRHRSIGMVLDNTSSSLELLAMVRGQHALD